MLTLHDMNHLHELVRREVRLALAESHTVQAEHYAYSAMHARDPETRGTAGLLHAAHTKAARSLLDGA